MAFTLEFFASLVIFEAFVKRLRFMGCRFR
jgi:hypothetical protein